MTGFIRSGRHQVSPSTLCYGRYRRLMVPCRPSTLCYSRHRRLMVPRRRHLHHYTALGEPIHAGVIYILHHYTTLAEPIHAGVIYILHHYTTLADIAYVHARPVDRPVRSRESIARGDIPSPPIPQTIDQLPLSDRRFFTHYGMRPSFHELLYKEFLVHTIRIIIL
jgi:hypothetical protein